MRKFFKSVFVWAIMLFSIGAIIWLCYKAYYVFNWHRPNFGTMPWPMVLLTALGISLVWISDIRLFRHTKPFNCMKCLTGWTALTLAFCFNVPFYGAYLFLGALAGAMFDKINNRYL